MGRRAIRDEELVSRIKSGDTQSFDILVENYFPRTYRKVRKLIPSEDAEDVTQDIFLNLVCSIDNFEGRSAFATWFNKIIANRVADYHRKSFRHRGRFVSEDEMPKNDPYQEPEMDMEMQDLLMKLPEHYREVLLMRFCNDLSFREISATLGIDYESVRSRYRRGIKYAARKLQPALPN